MRMLYSCCTVLFLALCALSQAQADAVITGDLPRQAQPGFRVSGTDAGLTVRNLDPESAAALGGLQDDDVITAVNGDTFNKAYIGQDLLRRLDGDVPAWLTVQRGDTIEQVRFTPTPAPLESLEGVDSVYGVLDMPDGSRLRTIITRPVTRPTDSIGILPAVFFVQWVSCNSVEINRPGATRDVMRALAERTGMAMIRVERSTAGDSEGPACHELDYNTEVEHYRHAFDLLTRSEGIDPDRIVVVGMSLGSTVAPLVVHDKPVIGITVGGGGAVTYFERMLNFDRIRLERMGVPPEEIHERMVRHVLFETEYLLRQKDPEQIAEEYPELAGVWDEMLGTGDGVHYGRPYAYHQQAAQRDFLEAWAAIDAPVLVTFGEFDQFELRHGHELITLMVNRLRPGTARFVEIPRMGHDYGVTATVEEAYSWTWGPAAPAHDAPELVISEILRWLRDDIGIDTIEVF